MLIFEYDLQKSKSNKKKHGIDFEEAKKLWLDDYYIEIPAKTVDEPRSLVIGKIADRHWSAVIAYRGEKVRIISVRCARKQEIEILVSDKNAIFKK